MLTSSVLWAHWPEPYKKRWCCRGNRMSYSFTVSWHLLLKKNLAVREESEENKELNKTADALRWRIIGLVSYIVILTTCQDHKVKWSLKWAVDLYCVQLLPHSATKQKDPLYLGVKNRTCVLVESVVHCISHSASRCWAENRINA